MVSHGETKAMRGLFKACHDCYISRRGVIPRFPFSDGFDAGWSSPVARQAHNLKVVGSNPTPATKNKPARSKVWRAFSLARGRQAGPKRIDPCRHNFRAPTVAPPRFRCAKV